MAEKQDFHIEGVIKSKASSTGTKDGNNWTRYAFVITKNDGVDLSLSSFDSELSGPFDVGNSVKCHYRFDGVKYNTLVGFEPLDGTPEVVKPGEIKPANKVPEPSNEYANKPQKMIVRQNVLNRAVELLIAGKITEEQLFERAEEFENWVSRP